MHKKLFLLSILCIGVCISILPGQEIDIIHSDVLNIGRNYEFGDYLLSDENGHFVYYFNDHAISIVELKRDLSDPFIDEIKTGDNDIHHVKLLAVGDIFYWITYTVNFKMKRFEYEYTPIGLDGRMGKPRKIVNFRYKNERRIPVFNYKYSPDSLKILLTLEIDYDRGDPYSAYMAVMDSEFNKLFESDYNTQVSQRQVESRGWSLTNDGQIYFLTKQFDKLSRKNEKKVKGKYFPAYEIRAHRHTAHSIEESAMGVEGEFVKTYDLACNGKGNVIAFLGYGYREKDPIVGFQFQRLDSTLTVNQTNTLVFTEYGINGYTEIEIIRNKRGEGLRPQFEMLQIQNDENGNFNALLDFHYLKENRDFSNRRFGGIQNITYSYIDLSMVCLSVDANGEFIKANILPRRYSSENSYVTGVSMISEGAGVNLFYNDFSYNLESGIENPDNRVVPRYQWPRDQNFVFTTIYNDNRIERTSLFNMQEEGRFTMPSKVYKIGNNEYFFGSIYSRGIGSNTAFGILSF